MGDMCNQETRDKIVKLIKKNFTGKKSDYH